MFGWFAVVRVPLMVLAVMLLVTVRFSKPVRLEVLIVPADTVLVTDRLPSSPTAVTFGWLAVVSVPLMVFALILPVTVSELKLPSEVILSSVPCARVPLKLPPSITPLTDRFVNWPIAVMLGWFAVVSVPLIVFAAMLLVTVRLSKPVRLEVLLVQAVTVLVTV